MALKCPECGTVAHARTAAYEAPSVKRSWYQCQNLECSCTFTALESVDTPGKTTANAQSLWLRVKTVKPSADSCLIRKKRPRNPGRVPGFLTPFPWLA